MDKVKHYNPTDVLALFTAVLAVSFSAVFIRLSAAPSLAIAAYRLGFTVLILVIPTVVLKRSELRRIKMQELGLAAIGGFFLAAHFYCYIASLSLTSIAHSVLFISTHPLFVIIASRIFLREKISIPAVFGSILALVGLAVITGGNIQAARDTIPGDMLALTGALMITGYLLVGRKMRRNYSTLSYTFLVYGAAALFLFIFAIIFKVPLAPYQSKEYLIFLALALVPTIMGHSVFNWALRKFSATVVSLLFLGEPICASILAWLIFSELPGVYFFPGALLVLTGLGLVVIRSSRENNRGQNLPELPQ